MKDFKEVFTPPFSFDGIFIYDTKGRISINTLMNSTEVKKVVRKLNGNTNKLKDGEYSVSKVEPGRILFTDDKVFNSPVLIIRGWGRLTGTGGLCLDNDVAAKLQDDFAQWIVETLNN